LLGKQAKVALVAVEDLPDRTVKNGIDRRTRGAKGSVRFAAVGAAELDADGRTARGTLGLAHFIVMLRERLLHV
jgi:hypothetical protein